MSFDPNTLAMFQIGSGWPENKRKQKDSKLEQLEVYEVLHDTAKGKSAVYATSSADTRFGNFKWAQECKVRRRRIQINKDLVGFSCEIH
ncbi:hypothetical protein E5D57_007852 [Metarhizium anisopliae]|nr:hypothetical protein E5D57_007852 [Metarhizium anisopliae]